MENKVVIYPIPQDAVRQRDYVVRIRPLGEEQWQELGCYQVKVDMHDIRPLSQKIVPVFENIDILEHHEFQPEYLGAMCINAGDKNVVRNVNYSNIRIEPFAHGKVLDFQVKQNKDYNLAPGRLISGVHLKQIYVTSGSGEEPSCISGYDEQANIAVGKYAKNVVLD